MSNIRVHELSGKPRHVYETLGRKNKHVRLINWKMFLKSVPSISDNLEHICIFKFVKHYRIPYTPHMLIILKKVNDDDGQAIKFRPPILCPTTKQKIVTNDEHFKPILAEMILINTFQGT